MDKDLAETLHTAGRDLASNFMCRAVEKSTDRTDMTHQLFILKVMAVHILATDIYNLSDYDRKNQEPFFNDVVNALRAEIEIVRRTDQEGDMVKVTPGEVPIDPKKLQ